MSAGARGGIHSMTGYGRAVKRTAAETVTAELRSTNHRYLEIDQRLPNGLAMLQARIAERIRGRVRRGRIEANVTIHAHRAHERRVVFDDRLLREYHDALVSLKGRFGFKEPVTLGHLLGLPQAMTVSEERVPLERLWEPVQQALDAALADLLQSRQREGAKLTADLRAQLRAIQQHIKAIQRRLPKALAEQRKRLRQRLEELLGHRGAVSGSQLEQAVALLKDADVHEELVRLDSHLAHMQQALVPTSAGIGKRMDFIAQELMRETNTIGSKVNDPVAIQHVVAIKGCIERIREQVQNLE